MIVQITITILFQHVFDIHDSEYILRNTSILQSETSDAESYTVRVCVHRSSMFDTYTMLDRGRKNRSGSANLKGIQ